MPMTVASRRAWVLVVGWALILLTMTSLPGEAVPISIPHPLDWVGHGSLYTVLGVLVARAESLNGRSGRQLVLVALTLMVAGALDELHQRWIPGRTAEVSDWLADSLGSAIGLTVGAFLMRTRVARWLR